MSDERPTFISLFAGIGGIDLGLERAGWECRGQVEIDPYCQRVLAKHWPDVPRYGDITTVDWSGVERVDLLAGGFPCQPVSSAGRQAAQEDPRWRWPEFHRAVRELRPRLVLVENVTNLLAVNDGSAFGDVLGDLAASGYDAEWDCIPASAIGALHERDRVWLVAYSTGERWDDAGAPQSREHQGEWPQPLGGRGGVAVADPERLRRARPREDVKPLHSEALAAWEANQPLDSRRWPAEPAVARVAHGLSRGLARRSEDAIRGFGNAVVPQVVEVIGRALLREIEVTSSSPLVGLR